MSDAMTLEKKVFELRFVLAWLGFTLSAGIVNAGAVLASDTVVTHITGNVTNVALDASLGVALLFVISLFIGGAMLASLVRETLRSHPRLAFFVPIAISTSTLLAVAFAGRLGAFGEFGQFGSAGMRRYLMLGLLAASMGMLNAAVAGVTGNQVRTTHLSGPATDLAGNIVRGLLGTGRGTSTELRWAGLRLAMLGTFGAGAFVAARLAGALRYDLFAVPALLLVGCVALTVLPVNAPALGSQAR